MRSKLFVVSIVMGFALVSMPALAGHRHHRQHDRQADKVAALAADLRKATAELASEAEESVRRRRGWVYWRALYTLRSLDRRAQHFQRQVAREGAFDRDTMREFRRLDHAFERASHRVAVFERRGVQRDFARVERIMNRLDTRFDQHEQRQRERHARRDRRDDRHHGRHDDRGDRYPARHGDYADRPWRVDLSWNAGY